MTEADVRLTYSTASDLFSERDLLKEIVFMEILFVPLALLAGVLLTVQVGANTQLSKGVGGPLAATTLQLGVGALALTLLSAVVGTLGAVSLLPEVTWWHAFGGLASAFYVCSTTVLFARLGAIVSVGLFIAGQMLASLALDGFGLLGIERPTIGLSGALGALAVVVGAAAIVGAQAGEKGAGRAASKPGWELLGLVAGAVLPVQGAVNALLRVDIGAPITVGAISFVVSTAGMALVLLFVVATGRAPRPRVRPLAGVPWWGWLGGLCGAAYVTTVFTAIPAIGATAVVGLTVTGQQVASVFFDRWGLMRMPAKPVTGVRLLGVGLLLVGVVLIQAL
jgi:transporter family-2 protein